MNRTEDNLLRGALFVAAILVVLPRAAGAQDEAAGGSVRHEVFPNTPADSYLRYLQSIGKVPAYPWASRPFSQRELRQLVPRDTVLHPWRNRFIDESRKVGKFSYGFIQPTTTLRYNSAFAYGSNDGPVWAGRGLTSAVQLGFYADWGPLSITVAPMAFRAENKAFDIRDLGRLGNLAFMDPNRGGIDRPQRFGDAAYSQVDPGQTTIRLDFPYVAVGASTGNQEWGPGQDLPVILGNNAAGFPHLFAGTSEPLDIFIASVHFKAMWGELFQSEYSPVTGPDRFISLLEPGRKRFTTGFVISAQPRGLTGLEIGASRFFHSVWPVSGIPRSYATKFLQGFLKKNLPPDPTPDPRIPEGEGRGLADNQLASIFFRWVVPRGGFEMHGEYGREDHGYDFRDVLQEIDHSRVYSFGARKVFRSRPGRLTAGRFELINFQLPQLARYREQGEIYTHGLLRQGHTNRGQMLGPDVGVGTGAGSVVAVDQYTTHGRWAAIWTRTVRQENGDYTLLGVRTPRSIDVIHALGYEASRFYGQYELTYGLNLMRDFNRDFKSDKTNLNALVGVRYLIR